MTKDQKQQIRKFVQYIHGKKVNIRFEKDANLRAWTFKRLNRICFNKELK